MKYISTEKAPKAIESYSQAIEVGNLINGEIEKKTEKMLENIKPILEAAKLGLDSVVK